MDSVILVAKRTAIASFQSKLSAVPAPKLGAAALSATLSEIKFPVDAVQSVVMGQVITAGVGQAPARQAALYAGLPHAVGALTVNKVCGSGLKAVMLTDDAIRLGKISVGLAGGMENMSLAPYALAKARGGYRMGNGMVEDLMIKDGLWDPYGDKHMGMIGELCAREKKYSREMQDEFAKLSYIRAQEAVNSGRFKNEIVPVNLETRKGNEIFEQDEEPFQGNPEKLTTLRPAFDKNGTITAGNASSINDGAAAVLMAGFDYAKAHGLKPIARIVAQAESSQSPDWFTTAPAAAIRLALGRAGLAVKDIDLWEVNEAFAVVALVNRDELGISPEKMNVNGGAVALGHPIGASGCRILVTLIHEMQKRAVRYGCASLCIGGGEGVAVIVELL